MEKFLDNRVFFRIFLFVLMAVNKYAVSTSPCRCHNVPDIFRRRIAKPGMGSGVTIDNNRGRLCKARRQCVKMAVG